MPSGRRLPANPQLTAVRRRRPARESDQTRAGRAWLVWVIFLHVRDHDGRTFLIGQSCGGDVAVALAARGKRLAFRRRELDLPQADALRRHLDTLVVPYELERLLERERAWRNEPDELVRGGGAHVRELFLLGGVDVEILAPGVLADDHALVNLHARADEQRSTFLERSYRETGRLASAIGDEAAGRTSSQLAVPRLPALEDVVHDPGTARLREELGTETDQPARRHEVLHAGPARAVVDHLLHPALPEREQLRDDADVLLRDIDGDPFDRLVLLPVEHAGQHLRLPHGELESLAPHDLDEDGELELSAPLYLPDIGARRRLHAQGDVSNELALEAGDQRAGRHNVALGACERGG